MRGRATGCQHISGGLVVFQNHKVNNSKSNKNNLHNNKIVVIMLMTVLTARIVRVEKPKWKSL